MGNVVYEWNSICDSSAKKVAEEPMAEFAKDLLAHETGFAGEYEEGDDWSDEVPDVDDYEEAELEEKLRELTEIPMCLYKQCREEEGMTKEEAIEETYNRFYESFGN